MSMVEDRREAGMKSPVAILEDIIREALRRHPLDSAARSATILNSIRPHADLLFEFQKLQTETLMQAWISRVRVTMLAGGKGRDQQAAVRDFHTEAAQKRRAALQSVGMAARAEVVRRCMLDQFIINGRPIGDCTPAEARGWSGRLARDQRFIELLIAGVPENKVIRQFIKPAEADAAWRQAEREVIGGTAA